MIFQNTQNARNLDIYKKIVDELIERVDERGGKFNFDEVQTRNKFKKLVGDCKRVALTEKTATGINRFQDEKGYGKWFKTLFDLIKTRQSCRPEVAQEPTAGANEIENDRGVIQENTSGDEVDDQPGRAGPPKPNKNLFVPTRSKKRKVDPTTAAVELMQKVLEKDPTKDLLDFYREENEKSRNHELKIMQLIMAAPERQNYQQQQVLQAPQQERYVQATPQQGYAYGYGHGHVYDHNSASHISPVPERQVGATTPQSLLHTDNSQTYYRL